MKMRTSETIAKLSEALAAAQGKMEAAKKNATNPFWGKTYATLDSIWEACRAALADNGLSVVQVPMTDESGQLRLITRLCHSSGEWIEGELVLKPAKEDLQGLGSAITYGRRYMLGAIVGVSIDEDDDGNEAATPQRETPRKSQKNSKPPAQKVQPNGNDKTKAATVKAKDLTPFDELVQAIPHYQKDGKPNMYHILMAAAIVGFDTVTDDNISDVIDAISQRYREERINEIESDEAPEIDGYSFGLH